MYLLIFSFEWNHTTLHELIQTLTNPFLDVIQSYDLLMERRVHFEEREFNNFFIIIPLPLSRSNVSENIAAFSTSGKDLRRFRTVLRFISLIFKRTRTQEILQLVEELIANPERKKDTLIFTEGYLFVKTSFRHETIPRVKEDLFAEEKLDLNELYDGAI